MTHQLSSPQTGWVDKTKTANTGDTSGPGTADFIDEDALNTKLTAMGYTAARIAQMNQNDKVYAIRVSLGLV